MSTTRMMLLYVPTDRKLLAALGRVVVVHGHLERILRSSFRRLVTCSQRFVTEPGSGFPLSQK